MFLQNRSLVELLSTALLRAHMGGSQGGGGVANVGVATKEEVAGDHREEGGDVMLLELAHASPGTHCKKKIIKDESSTVGTMNNEHEQ